MTRNLADKIFTAFLLLVTTGALWMTRNWTYKVYFFPRFIETVMLGLLVVQLVLLFVRPATPEGETKAVMSDEAALERSRFISILLWFLGFVALILLFGFPIGGTLATFAYLRWTAKEGWGMTFGVSVIVAIFFWISGNPKLLGVPYPDGWIISILP